KAEGGEAFKQLLKNAEGFFDFYLYRLCTINPPATDKGRLAILRGMAEAVYKTGNGVLIDKYAQKTALRLGVTPDAGRAEVKKLSHGKPGGQETEPDETVAPIAPPTPQEQWLLKLALLQEGLVEWIGAHLDPTWVQHPVAREVLVRRLKAQADQSWTS